MFGMQTTTFLIFRTWKLLDISETVFPARGQSAAGVCSSFGDYVKEVKAAILFCYNNNEED